MTLERRTGAEGNDRHKMIGAEFHDFGDIFRALLVDDSVRRIVRGPGQGVSVLLAPGLRVHEPVAETRGERACNGLNRRGIGVAGKPRSARRRGHFVHYQRLSLFLLSIAGLMRVEKLRRSTPHLEYRARRAFGRQLLTLVLLKPLNLVVKRTHALVDLRDRKSIKRLADLMT